MAMPSADERCLLLAAGEFVGFVEDKEVLVLDGMADELDVKVTNPRATAS